MLFLHNLCIRWVLVIDVLFYCFLHMLGLSYGCSMLFSHLSNPRLWMLDQIVRITVLSPSYRLFD